MSNLIPGEIIPEQGEIELNFSKQVKTVRAVSYTHLRAHETG